MHVLVITNDSTVFLKDGICSAKDMFGGRVTEVRNFCNRLASVCGVSFGIISGRFGFVPGEYVVMPYNEVTDTPEAYLALQERKDYATTVNVVSRPFDRIIVFVPKAMMAILLDNDAFPRKVIAVTDDAFKEEFERRGWSWYGRSGARIGKANADKIFEEVKETANQEEKRRPTSGASS
ncbi:MAG: hypothetical protein LBH69_01400 [Methanomassiliicoccaceae archaeon]|jgi:hypothetical protein|nr:hypothetical protein [Methanomassiliicoccaceae archaeon]